MHRLCVKKSVIWQSYVQVWLRGLDSSSQSFKTYLTFQVTWCRWLLLFGFIFKNSLLGRWSHLPVNAVLWGLLNFRDKLDVLLFTLLDYFFNVFLSGGSHIISFVLIFYKLEISIQLILNLHLARSSSWGFDRGEVLVVYFVLPRKTIHQFLFNWLSFRNNRWCLCWLHLWPHWILGVGFQLIAYL